MNLEDMARADATGEVAAALCAAAGGILKKHGADPDNPAILAGGFVLAINTITKEIDPTFRKRLMIQLMETS